MIVLMCGDNASLWTLLRFAVGLPAPIKSIHTSLSGHSVQDAIRIAQELNAKKVTGVELLAAIEMIRLGAAQKANGNAKDMIRNMDEKEASNGSRVV